MVDSALEPHLLEVNTKPQLLPLPLDRSVNSKSLFDENHNDCVNVMIW